MFRLSVSFIELSVGGDDMASGGDDAVVSISWIIQVDRGASQGCHVMVVAALRGLLFWNCFGLRDMDVVGWESRWIGLGLQQLTQRLGGSVCAVLVLLP